MDGQPWPGYAAHVLEHFLALGRLNVLRFAERVEVLAAQHGQRAQLQVLQYLGRLRFFLSWQKLSMEELFEPCHRLENFQSVPCQTSGEKTSSKSSSASFLEDFGMRVTCQQKSNKENYPPIFQRSVGIDQWAIAFLYYCSCEVHNSGSEWILSARFPTTTIC